jgi:CGNR zinc finger
MRRSYAGCTLAIDIINGAAYSTAQRLLTVTTAGELAVADSACPSGIDRVLSAIASQVIDAVDRGTLLLNQICSRPDCDLFYFRDHHRRRYCNVRCANADRQARYHTRLAERLDLPSNN